MKTIAPSLPHFASTCNAISSPLSYSLDLFDYQPSAPGDLYPRGSCSPTSYGGGDLTGRFLQSSSAPVSRGYDGSSRSFLIRSSAEASGKLRGNGRAGSCSPPRRPGSPSSVAFDVLRDQQMFDLQLDGEPGGLELAGKNAGDEADQLAQLLLGCEPYGVDEPPLQLENLELDDDKDLTELTSAGCLCAGGGGGAATAAPAPSGLDVALVAAQAKPDAAAGIGAAAATSAADATALPSCWAVRAPFHHMLSSAGAAHSPTGVDVSALRTALDRQALKPSVRIPLEKILEAPATAAGSGATSVTPLMEDGVPVFGISFAPSAMAAVATAAAAPAPTPQPRVVNSSHFHHKTGGPCDHCGVKESPQWRRGPTDKPVLCNACGTRFRRTNQLAPATAKANNKRRSSPKERDVAPQSQRQAHKQPRLVSCQA